MTRTRRALAALLVLTFAFGTTVSISEARQAAADRRGWCTLAFPATNLDVKVELALGADLTSPASWVWTDITQYVRHESRIVISRGRGDEWTQTGPSQAVLTLDNTDGRFTRLNPVGAYYGQLRRNTPLRIRVNNGSGYVARFTGYVTKWPPRWDLSEKNQFAPITADGVFRRLGQGDPLRSAMFRSAIGVAPNDYVPHAYWPMEDGGQATAFASAISGHPAMTVSGAIKFAAESTMAGSDPLPTFSTGAKARVSVPGYASTSQWVHLFTIRIPQEPASEQIFAEFTTSGTAARMTVSVEPGNPATVWLKFYDSSGTSLGGTGQPLAGGFDFQPTEAEFFGHWAMIFVGSKDNNDGTFSPFFSLTIDREFSLAGVSVTGAHGGLLSIEFIAAMDDVGFGHSQTFIDPAFNFAGNSDAENNAAAMSGHVGELAHDRVKRLCDEEQIPVAITGTSSAPMGRQSSDTLLNLLRDAEAADLGVLFETLDGKVGYRTNANRYNASAFLTLDYNSRQVQDPWAPEDDDQRIRNDITVSRPDGSFARDDDQASIDREGRYKQPHTANVESDSQLANTAGWLLHLGTWDELRFPAVGFKLHRHTTLINTWQSADPLTKRLDITNLPSPIPPDTTQQSIEGYTETIGSRDWDVALNTAPYGPYSVAVLDSASLGKLDTAGCELMVARNATDTSWTVHTTKPPKWTTTAGEMPIPMIVAGERLSCTAVSNVSPSFVAAGTAAHANNASVTPGLPAGLAAGDLLLVWCAIRNSGTGTVNTPSGFTLLADMSNARLFGKYSASGETAPTITFAGGVANADTSAQCAAFRGVGLTVHSVKTQLNASAQDIAYPALSIPYDNSLVLYLGWKQDDWTSVATIASATEIGEPDTITGDDQGIVWDFVQQTTLAPIAAGSFTVTGGAAAISRGAVVALGTDVQTLTVTRSVNGVSKSQVARAAILEYQPARLAL